jgi:hypothetical protein
MRIETIVGGIASAGRRRFGPYDPGPDEETRDESLAL